MTISAASASRCSSAFLRRVVDVDVAFGCARDDHDAHAGHCGAGRVRAVRGRRDQDDVAPRLAAIAVIGADDHQPGELALCARSSAAARRPANR